MGVLIHRDDIRENAYHTADPESIFEEIVQEFIEIINGSHIEKYSTETKGIGFMIDIIKTEKEKAEKKFVIYNNSYPEN
jgi:hypothetical protein